MRAQAGCRLVTRPARVHLQSNGKHGQASGGAAPAAAARRAVQHDLALHVRAAIDAVRRVWKIVYQKLLVARWWR